MEKNPKVSVVIPTYNSAQFIVETLESVFAQTYKDYEVIVVDDGSTDNTREVLKPYMSKIRYIYKENGGVASARNVGIKNARGEYIAFLDSDDLWLPEKLEKQMEYFKSNPDVVLVFSDCILFGDKELIRKKNTKRIYSYKYKGDMFLHLLQENFIPTLTVIAKKECFDEVGYFDTDESLISSEDYDMWLRIARSFKIGYIEEPLAKRRVSRKSLSFSNINRAYMATLKVIRKTVDNIEDKSLNKRKFLKNRLLNLYLNWGLSHFVNNNFKEARGQFVLAIKHNPINLRAIIYYIATFLTYDQVEIIRKIKRKLKEGMVSLLRVDNSYNSEIHRTCCKNLWREVLPQGIEK